MALRPPRLAYIDITKGLLVILMVVYHTINYTQSYATAFRYLCFLPLSFILITGFLLGRVSRSRVLDRPAEGSSRLVVRGMRLVVLFTVLNVLAQVVAGGRNGSRGVENFFAHWDDVYIEGGSRLAAFDVLLPIGYLVALSPVLLRLGISSRISLAVLTAIVLACCIIADLLGHAHANAFFISVGVLGLIVGMSSFDPAGLKNRLPILAVGYATYLPIGMLRGWVFGIQVLGAVVALALIAALASYPKADSWAGKRIIVLGQYSLVAYIAQIAVLQLIARVIGRPELFSAGSAILFATAMIATSVTVEATHWCRGAFLPIDKAYRAIFA